VGRPSKNYHTGRPAINFEMNKGLSFGGNMLVEITKGPFKGERGRIQMPKTGLRFGGGKPLNLDIRLESGKTVLFREGMWKLVKEFNIWDEADKENTKIASEAQRKENQLEKVKQLANDINEGAVDLEEETRDSITEKIRQTLNLSYEPLVKVPDPEPEPEAEEKLEPVLAYCGKCKRDMEMSNIKEDGKLLRGRCQCGTRIQKPK